MGKVRFLILIIAATFITVACGTKCKADDSRTGNVKFKLPYMYALHQNGHRYPEKDKECIDKFKEYVGKDMRVMYNITPTTKTARAEFDKMTFVLKYTGSLEYEFGLDNPPNFPQAQNVFFAIMAPHFTDPQGSIFFLVNSEYNCELCSQTLP